MVVVFTFHGVCTKRVAGTKVHPSSRTWALDGFRPYLTIPFPPRLPIKHGVMPSVSLWRCMFDP